MTPTTTPHQRWTREEEAFLRECYAQGMPHQAVADAINARFPRPRPRTRAAVESKATQLGIGPWRSVAIQPFEPVGATLTRDVPTQADGVTVAAPLETGGEPDDAFVRRMLASTDRARARDAGERFVRVRIASREPIAISLSSDWHVSPSGCDLRGLISYVDAIGATPGAYAMVVGDLTDNPIKHRGGSVREVPDEQRMLDHLVGRMRGKLVCMTSGNHDDWSLAFSGLDSLAALAARHRVHYAPDELVVLVEIVDPDDADHVTARWVVAMRHQYRRHSVLNYTHACWRWLEEMANDWPTDAEGRTLLPDVLAIGHHHVAAVETRSTPRGDVVACRMGAWQVDSSFARAKGFPRSRPTAPTIILPPVRPSAPGEPGPVAYADYRAALDHLSRVRSSDARAA